MRISLLGASGVGKTTFLVAAHASSLHRAADADLRLTSPAESQRHRLSSHWARLAEHRIFPPSTDSSHDWTFDLEVPPGGPFAVAVHDHRGGVLEDTATPIQTESLISRLTEADGVLLVLDGRVLGERVAGRTDGRWDLARARRALWVGRLSGVLADVVSRRRRAGGAPQSLAVVVTKTDELVRSAGPEAVAGLTDHLRRLVPAVFDPAIVTAICPVGLPEDRGRTMSPSGFLGPFAFVALGRTAPLRQELKTRLGDARDRRTTTGNRPRSSARERLAQVERNQETVVLQDRFTALRHQTNRLLAELVDCSAFRGDEPVPHGVLGGVANPWSTLPLHPVREARRSAR